MGTSTNPRVGPIGRVLITMNSPISSEYSSGCRHEHGSRRLGPTCSTCACHRPTARALPPPGLGEAAHMIQCDVGCSFGAAAASTIGATKCTDSTCEPALGCL